MTKWKVGNVLSRRDELRNQYYTKRVNNGNKLMLTDKKTGRVIFAERTYCRHGQVMA